MKLRSHRRGLSPATQDVSFARKLGLHGKLSAQVQSPARPEVRTSAQLINKLNLFITEDSEFAARVPLEFARQLGIPHQAQNPIEKIPNMNSMLLVNRPSVP